MGRSEVQLHPAWPLLQHLRLLLLLSRHHACQGQAANRQGSVGSSQGAPPQGQGQSTLTGCPELGGEGGDDGQLIRGRETVGLHI